MKCLRKAHKRDIVSNGGWEPFKEIAKARIGEHKCEKCSILPLPYILDNGWFADNSAAWIDSDKLGAGYWTAFIVSFKVGLLKIHLLLVRFYSLASVGGQREARQSLPPNLLQ